ncbi:hypothetical protein RclHR1_00960022 [Rhizophagus clarus]|uniref:Protein kinase domain-containing protein n=1 Tax=Rhizophagus clarus TaxID=94130 RepID=A0A2Z6SF26_9GLOM|nr:hypothetical protein RclHR1_00960022 [Rhizophagus clarus]
MSFQQDIADYLEYSKYLKNKFTDWTSGCERIDTLIQKRQLKIEGHSDVIFEWIPFGQFDKIKETSKNGSITVYSAIWKNGPLTYDWDYEGYTRDSNKEVALKLMKNSQNPIEFVINEVKKYKPRNNEFLVLYGISQNPDTNDYILVQNNSINLANCISGNEKIDDFIQERQLKIKDHKDVVFEWIPYNQFKEIKETGKNDIIALYSAIWKDGPLTYDQEDQEYARDSNKEVALKLIHNSQNSIELVINEAKNYSLRNDRFLVLHGLSQNPDTNDYILVRNDSINLTNCISGNEKIDDFIIERQSKIKVYSNYTIFEWIPYNQFNEIKETSKNDTITVYSAIWRDGPLTNDHRDEEYTRNSNKQVTLKLIHNSQNSIEFVINKAKKYLPRNDQFLVLYGISQNPDTDDYILVQNNSINLANCTSGNEKIDDFILERQSKIKVYSNYTVFEWIPYNQFNEIKETGKNEIITVYSATWKDGPLYSKNQMGNYDLLVDNWRDEEFIRDSNKIVALKLMHNSRNSIEFIINETKKYSSRNGQFQELYGISQNPDTNDHILVFNWTSGNEKIDDFIQERRLKVNDHNDVLFEWIPYNQFNEIKETVKNDTTVVYSAIWGNGPLYKKYQWSNYERDSNKEVALKVLHNSQNSIELVVNEV